MIMPVVRFADFVRISGTVGGSSLSQPYLHNAKSAAVMPVTL